MIRSRARHVGTQESAMGIDRFFSPRNLCRYRKLAGGAISEIEQIQLLEELAEEMNTFRRESRMATGNRRSVPKESVGSQVVGQVEHATRICLR